MWNGKSATLPYVIFPLVGPVPTARVRLEPSDKAELFCIVTPRSCTCVRPKSKLGLDSSWCEIESEWTISDMSTIEGGIPKDSLLFHRESSKQTS